MNDGHWRFRYRALRERGHSHGRALRSIADRLLGVLVAMLKSGTTYDNAITRRHRTNEQAESVPTMRPNCA